MNYVDTSTGYWAAWPSAGLGKKKKKEKIKEYIHKHIPLDYIPGLSKLFITPTKDKSEECKTDGKLEDKIKIDEEYW